MSYNGKNFQVDFDFLDHKLKIVTSKGEFRDFSLENISVADFYHSIFTILKELDIDLEIYTTLVEMEDPIPFEQDDKNNTYDKEQASALHQALLKAQNVLTHMRCNFTGKCSPVHFFWGSFDLPYRDFQDGKHPNIRAVFPIFRIGWRRRHIPMKWRVSAFGQAVRHCPKLLFMPICIPRPKVMIRLQ